MVGIVAKTEKKLSKLTKLMPNLGAPGSCKRSTQCSAIHSMILYRASIWGRAIKVRKYNAKSQLLQRSMFLRVGSAQRTLPRMTVQVITGVIPIVFLALERCYMHQHRHDDQKLRKKKAGKRGLTARMAKQMDKRTREDPMDGKTNTGQKHMDQLHRNQTTL